MFSFWLNYLLGVSCTCTDGQAVPSQSSCPWHDGSGTRSWSGFRSGPKTPPARTSSVWRCTRSSGIPIRVLASDQTWTSSVVAVDERLCGDVEQLEEKFNILGRFMFRREALALYSNCSQVTIVHHSQIWSRHPLKLGPSSRLRLKVLFTAEG